ncbi:NAD(+)/NADH kinase domain-containing protein [Toxoplasma gondii VEG]|uniref:NAD(+)/NADH kinase domain-containing protein n=1 Tax=Toxoplasma gondii (strain ATCC 50861 / VEG) TaxID=432359 RepID=V4ZHB9_TOXGV|nr:NAD(+)/NADH kinase domain-containing protein [Toxoplasma gondii VEG]
MDVANEREETVDCSRSNSRETPRSASAQEASRDAEGESAGREEREEREGREGEEQRQVHLSAEQERKCTSDRPAPHKASPEASALAQTENGERMRDSERRSRSEADDRRGETRHHGDGREEEHEEAKQAAQEAKEAKKPGFSDAPFVQVQDWLPQREHTRGYERNEEEEEDEGEDDEEGEMEDKEETPKSRSTVQIVQRRKEECYCVTEVDYIPRFWTTDLVCYFTNRPKVVLLIKRISSPSVTREAASLAMYMHRDLGLTVIVEPSAAEEMAAATRNAIPLKTWVDSACSPRQEEDSSRTSSSVFSPASAWSRTSPSPRSAPSVHLSPFVPASPSHASSSSSSSSCLPSSSSASSCSFSQRDSGAGSIPPPDASASASACEGARWPGASTSARRRRTRKRSSSPGPPAHLSEAVDLVVALGGDGTMLWVSRLFAASVPPVLGVSMGSLGYLTRFSLEEARRQLAEMTVRKEFSVNLRCRLKVCLLSAEEVVLESFVAFNECVIDRGFSSNLCSLDVYCNDCFFTTVAADGLILATPTGSTAYSMSAGGSMVHPKVPCILFTPICPHSLSFRPLILPDSVVLRIVAPEDARGSIWIAVDGRSRTQVKRGVSVLVSLSAFPFPMVARHPASCQDTWLESLKKGLNWNLRIRQGGLGGSGESPESLSCRSRWRAEGRESHEKREAQESESQSSSDESNQLSPRQCGVHCPRTRSSSRLSEVATSSLLRGPLHAFEEGERRLLSTSSASCFAESFSPPPSTRSASLPSGAAASQGCASSETPSTVALQPAPGGEPSKRTCFDAAGRHETSEEATETRPGRERQHDGMSGKDCVPLASSGVDPSRPSYRPAPPRRPPSPCSCSSCLSCSSAASLLASPLPPQQPPSRRCADVQREVHRSPCASRSASRSASRAPSLCRSRGSRRHEDMSPEKSKDACECGGAESRLAGVVSRGRERGTRDGDSLAFSAAPGDLGAGAERPQAPSSVARSASCSEQQTWTGSPSRSLPSSSRREAPRLAKQRSPEVLRGPVLRVSSLQSCSPESPESLLWASEPVKALSRTVCSFRFSQDYKREHAGDETEEEELEGGEAGEGSEVDWRGRATGRECRAERGGERVWLDADDSAREGRRSGEEGGERDRSDGEDALKRRDPAASLCVHCSVVRQRGRCLPLAEWSRHQVNHHRVHRVISYGEEGEISRRRHRTSRQESEWAEREDGAWREEGDPREDAEPSEEGCSRRPRRSKDGGETARKAEGRRARERTEKKTRDMEKAAGERRSGQGVEETRLPRASSEDSKQDLRGSLKTQEKNGERETETRHSPSECVKQEQEAEGHPKETWSLEEQERSELTIYRCDRKAVCQHNMTRIPDAPASEPRGNRQDVETRNGLELPSSTFFTEGQCLVPGAQEDWGGRFDATRVSEEVFTRRAILRETRQSRRASEAGRDSAERTAVSLDTDEQEEKTERAESKESRETKEQSQKASLTVGERAEVSLSPRSSQVEKAVIEKLEPGSEEELQSVLSDEERRETTDTGAESQQAADVREQEGRPSLECEDERADEAGGLATLSRWQVDQSDLPRKENSSSVLREASLSVTSSSSSSASSSSPAVASPAFASLPSPSPVSLSSKERRIPHDPTNAPETPLAAKASDLQKAAEARGCAECLSAKVNAKRSTPKVISSSTAAPGNDGASSRGGSRSLFKSSSTSFSQSSSRSLSRASVDSSSRSSSESVYRSAPSCSPWSSSLCAQGRFGERERTVGSDSPAPVTERLPALRSLSPKVRGETPQKGDTSPCRSGNALLGVLARGGSEASLRSSFSSPPKQQSFSRECFSHQLSEDLCVGGKAKSHFTEKEESLLPAIDAGASRPLSEGPRAFSDSLPASSTARSFLGVSAPADAPRNAGLLASSSFCPKFCSTSPQQPPSVSAPPSPEFALLTASSLPPNLSFSASSPSSFSGSRCLDPSEERPPWLASPQAQKPALPRCAFSAGALLAAFPEEEQSRMEQVEEGDNNLGSVGKRPWRRLGYREGRIWSETGRMRQTTGVTRPLCVEPRSSGSRGGKSRKSSVFMLPTGECTTMVRLVSRSGRKSSEVFRDVQDLSSFSSASTPLVSPAESPLLSTTPRGSHGNPCRSRRQLPQESSTGDSSVPPHASRPIQK